MIIIEIATAMIVTQTGTAMAAMTEIKGTGIGEIAIAAIGTVDSRSSGNFRDAARHIGVQILGAHLGKVVAEIALPHVLHGLSARGAALNLTIRSLDISTSIESALGLIER